MRLLLSLFVKEVGREDVVGLTESKGLGLGFRGGGREGKGVTDADSPCFDCVCWRALGLGGITGGGLTAFVSL